MKPMPDADENRRLAGVQNEKADKLPEGAAKESHLKRPATTRPAPIQTTGVNPTCTRQGKAMPPNPMSVEAIRNG